MSTMHKKMMGLAFCIVSFAVSSAAQTNTFPASGNVGIGTTSPPAYPLDVNGAGHFSGALYADGGISPSKANTNLGISATGTGWFYLNGQGTGATLIGNGTGNAQIYGGYIDLQSAIISASGTGTTNFSIGSYTSGDPQLGFKVDGTQKAFAGWSRANSYWYLGTVPYTPSLIVNSSGNVGIGTTNPGTKLEVDGSVKLTANSGASITFQDGTVQSTAYTGVTCGGDYAESVDVTGGRTSYEPGDLLVIDPGAPGKFLKSNQAYSTLVAGIYSTKPGTLGRRETTYAKINTTEVPMAMMGIVPTKVTAENGAIKIGDLLVASSTMGRAMKGTDRSLLTRAVIGKALGSLDSGTGVIEVLVTLQ
jgi:hypothetical protein